MIFMNTITAFVSVAVAVELVSGTATSQEQGSNND